MVGTEHQPAMVAHHPDAEHPGHIPELHTTQQHLQHLPHFAKVSRHSLEATWHCNIHCRAAATQVWHASSSNSAHGAIAAQCPVAACRAVPLSKWCSTAGCKAACTLAARQLRLHLQADHSVQSGKAG